MDLVIQDPTNSVEPVELARMGDDHWIVMQKAEDGSVGSLVVTGTTLRALADAATANV